MPALSLPGEVAASHCIFLYHHYVHLPLQTKCCTVFRLSDFIEIASYCTRHFVICLFIASYAPGFNYDDG